MRAVWMENGAGMRGGYDLAIIGGGFAGLVCARSAALRGLRTLLLERQPAPGHRVHTTGLLVKEVAERWEVPPRCTRRIRGVRLYGPSLSSIDLDSPGYYFLATDTPRLLAWFAREAGRAGAHLHYGAAFRGIGRAEDRIELSGCGAWSRFLVGADGARSAVARHLGLGRNRAFLLGVEAEIVGLRGLDPDRLHCFIDSELIPGYIGWAFIGVGGIAQVGLACRRPARPDLPAFIARLARCCDVGDARVIGRRGGLIPVGGRVAPFGADRVLLVGDAAGIVSPLTAGGIHTALDSGWRPPMRSPTISATARRRRIAPSPRPIRASSGSAGCGSCSTRARRTGSSMPSSPRRRCGHWRNRSSSTAGGCCRPRRGTTCSAAKGDVLLGTKS